jgi:hypothetical protein
MLQPHSLLWHYLWVAPYVILAILAFLVWRRGLHKQFPAFFCYAIFESAGGGIIYAIDISPSVSGPIYWRTYFSFLLIEVLIKFVIIGEIFVHLLRPYPSLGKLARALISGIGIFLVFTATIIAAFANPTPFWLISATRILGRSDNVVQSGLIVLVFVFAAYFHLNWRREVFGIALGFAISACVYLFYWAIMAEWLLGQKSYFLDFANMATYLVCVLIWCYYLLFPKKRAPTSTVLLPDHSLEVWNRELERLLQQ